jgi:hypothetical protein
MRFKLVLAIAVLLAVSANRPCFAKDGHAQHGARTSAANNGTSGKGASGANPPANEANVSIDADETVAPPVLPPHGQQQMRTSNPSVKIVIPTNSSRGQAGASTAPTARNPIGQPIVSPRNFVGAQPPVLPALQAPGAVSLPIVHGAPGGSAAPPVPLGTARINVANAPNRGSINGATVVRPATAPSVIGGPAAARYGINGTTVQSKH